jgi:hypothetical protein
MFEVTRRKHVSTTVAGDLRHKVQIIEAHSHGNAQTLLLEAMCPTRSTRGHLVRGSRADRISSHQIKQKPWNNPEEEEEEADSSATSGIKEAVLSCCNLCLHSVAVVTHRACALQ